MQLPRRNLLTAAFLALTTPRQTVAGLGGRAEFPPRGRIVSPEDFGAVGDGVGDDTAAVQSALDTLMAVQGRAGAVYLCSKVRGTFHALQLRSNMRWEGNGSTIKLANSQRECALLRTEYTNTDGAAVSSNIVFKGRVDGNEQNQGPIVAGDTYFCPTIHANGIANCLFDLEIINFYIGGFYSYGRYATNLDNTLNLVVCGGRGTGSNIVGTRWRTGPMVVSNCKHVNASATGNPAIFDVRDSTIGDISATNCGWGIKFQNTTARTTIGNLLNVAGPLTQNDFAVKFQGDVANGYNRDVTVDAVVCEGHPATGLYLFANRGLSIGRYLGRGNGTSSALGINDTSDCQIIDSEVTIGTLRSENPAGHALMTLNETKSVTIGILEIVAPQLKQAVYARGSPRVGRSITNIGTMLVSQTPPGWNAVLVAVENKAEVYVGELVTSARFADYARAGAPLLISYTPATALVQTGPINFDGSSTTGTIELAAAATHTDDRTIAAGYLQGACGPLVTVRPANASALALSASLEATPFSVPLSGRLGLRIRHGSTGRSSTATVLWSVDGWRAPWAGPVV